MDGGADQEGDGGRSLSVFWLADAAQIGELSSIMVGMFGVLYARIIGVFSVKDL